jgi:cardiolipin synthase A/B
MCSYARTGPKGLKKALERALHRGVTGKLILESIKVGKIALRSLGRLGSPASRRLMTYVWPHEYRPSDEAGHRGSFHLKCAVADGRLVMISSANLMEFAFDLNMELGVLARGNELGKVLTEHLLELMDRGVRQPATRQRRLSDTT